MVEKLNEATFKPLFGRMYDWAAIKSDTEPQGKLKNQVTRLQARIDSYAILRR
jgi:hypothetical protein